MKIIAPPPQIFGCRKFFQSQIFGPNMQNLELKTASLEKCFGNIENFSSAITAVSVIFSCL